MISPGTRAGVLDIADVGAVTSIGADGGNATALALAGFLFGFGSGLGFAFPFALTACAFGCDSVFGDAFPFALTVFAFGDALPFAPSFAEPNADFDAGRFMVSRLALDRRLRSAASSQLLPMRNLRLEARIPTVFAQSCYSVGEARRVRAKVPPEHPELHFREDPAGLTLAANRRAAKRGPRTTQSQNHRTAGPKAQQ